MGWFLIRIDKSKKPLVVTLLYEKPEQAIDSILPKIFENMWLNAEDVWHRRAGGIKKEENKDYSKGYKEGLYPVFDHVYSLSYFTYDDILNKIMKDEYYEDADPDTYHIDEYYLMFIK